MSWKDVRLIALTLLAAYLGWQAYTLYEQHTQMWQALTAPRVPTAQAQP